MSEHAESITALVNGERLTAACSTPCPLPNLNPKKLPPKKNPLCIHTAGFSLVTPAEAGITPNYLAASIADLAASAALSASALAASAASSTFSAAWFTASAACSTAGAASAAGAAGASTAGAAASGAGASTAGAAGATGASSFLPQATRAAEAITVAKMKAFFISIPLRVEKGCSAVHMHDGSAASAVPEMDIVCTLAFPFNARVTSLVYRV